MRGFWVRASSSLELSWRTDAHFSFALRHDMPSRAGRFANRADALYVKGLSSDLTALWAQAP